MFHLLWRGITLDEIRVIFPKTKTTWIIFYCIYAWKQLILGGKMVSPLPEPMCTLFTRKFDTPTYSTSRYSLHHSWVSVGIVISHITQAKLFLFNTKICHQRREVTNSFLLLEGYQDIFASFKKKCNVRIRSTLFLFRIGSCLFWNHIYRRQFWMTMFSSRQASLGH